MSIDARGRAAADELKSVMARGGVVGSVDEIRSTSRRRRARRSVVGASLTVALVALTGVLVAVNWPQSSSTSPASTGGQSPSPTPSLNSALCEDPAVVCDGRTVSVSSLPASVTVTLPTGFPADNVSFDASMVQAAIHFHGVTVFEHVRPMQWQRYSSVDPTAGSTAQSMATWLAHRPFVQPTEVRPVTIGGRHGYLVDVALRPGADLPATKAGHPAGITFTAGHGSAAVSAQLKRARYVLIDVPGAGVAVIWSWTYGGPVSDLEVNQPLADSVRFG